MTEFFVGVYLGMTISFGCWMIGRFLRARDLVKIEKAPVAAEANSPIEFRWKNLFNR